MLSGFPPPNLQVHHRYIFLGLENLPLCGQGKGWISTPFLHNEEFCWVSGQHSLILMWSFSTKNILTRPLHQLGLKPHKWTSLRAHHGLPYPRSNQNVKLWGNGKQKSKTSWWFNQPIWKVCVKMGMFPQVGEKIKEVGNNHLGWWSFTCRPKKWWKLNYSKCMQHSCTTCWDASFPSLIIVNTAKLQFLFEPNKYYSY